MMCSSLLSRSCILGADLRWVFLDPDLRLPSMAALNIRASVYDQSLEKDFDDKLNLNNAALSNARLLM